MLNNVFNAGRGRGRASILPAWMTNPEDSKLYKEEEKRKKLQRKSSSSERRQSKRSSRFDQYPKKVLKHSRSKSVSSSIMDTSSRSTSPAKRRRGSSSESAGSGRSSKAFEESRQRNRSRSKPSEISPVRRDTARRDTSESPALRKTEITKRLSDGKNQSPSRKYSSGRYSPAKRYSPPPRRKSPRRFSPRRYSPRRYSPRRYSPRRYSPRRYSPRRYSPRRYSPRRYSPRRHSPRRRYSPRRQSSRSPRKGSPRHVRPSSPAKKHSVESAHQRYSSDEQSSASRKADYSIDKHQRVSTQETTSPKRKGDKRRSRSKRKLTSTEDASVEEAPNKSPKRKRYPSPKLGYVNDQKNLSPAHQKSASPKKKKDKSSSLGSDARSVSEKGAKSESKTRSTGLKNLHDLESFCNQLNDIKNIASTSEKRNLLEELIETYTDPQTFTYETPDGTRYGVDSFEKMVVHALPVRITRKVYIDKKDESGSSYMIEMEWCPKKETSLVVLYVWLNKKLTRCYEFQDTTGIGALHEEYKLRALQETKIWAIIRRYLLKKGLPGDTQCRFVDCTTKYKHSETFSLQ